MKFPNNSLFAVNDYRFVSQSYSEILERLKDVILLPDPETNIGQFIEQFLIIAYLDLHKKTYGSVYKTNPIKILKDANPHKLNKFKFVHLQSFKNLDSHSYKLLNYFYKK
jgi:hypothetical protein